VLYPCTVLDYDIYLLSTQCSSVLEVGYFSVSPSTLHLPPGGWAVFTVVFTPPAVGDYSGQFQMACDNGQVLTFTMKGEL